MKNIKIEIFKADVSKREEVNKLVNPEATIIIHTEYSNKGKDIFNNVIELKDGRIINDNKPYKENICFEYKPKKTKLKIILCNIFNML